MSLFNTIGLQGDFVSLTPLFCHSKAMAETCFGGLSPNPPELAVLSLREYGRGYPCGFESNRECVVEKRMSRDNGAHRWGIVRQG